MGSKEKGSRKGVLIYLLFASFGEVKVRARVRLCSPLWEREASCRVRARTPGPWDTHIHCTQRQGEEGEADRKN